MVRRSMCIGEVGWEVVWTTDVPFDEEMDCYDHDAGTEHERVFTSEDLARKFAEKVYSQDFYGSVRVSKFQLEYLVPEDCAGCSREYIGETIHYEGPEGGWNE